MNKYICSKYEHIWVQLPVRMTVRIILEPYTYSTKIVRRRLCPLLLYRVTFALRSCEMYLHEWCSVQCESTGIQHVSCATNTITTCSPCVSLRMKLIRAGYTNFLNMFKNFVLATHTRRTLFEWIVIVIVIALMTSNDQEWSLEPTRMVDSCWFGDRFGTVGLGHNCYLVTIFFICIICEKFEFTWHSHSWSFANVIVLCWLGAIHVIFLSYYHRERTKFKWKIYMISHSLTRIGANF